MLNRAVVIHLWITLTTGSSLLIFSNLIGKKDMSFFLYISYLCNILPFFSRNSKKYIKRVKVQDMLLLKRKEKKGSNVS